MDCNKDIAVISRTFESIFSQSRTNQDHYISLEEYLSACSGLANIVGKIAKMKFVQKDMNGNVTKIKHGGEIYGTTTLQETLLKENEAGKDTATVGLLWLNRAIAFTSKLITGTVESEKSFKECVTEAYNQTLRPYHGKTIVGVVKTAMVLVPKRSKVVKELLKSSSEIKDEDELKQYLESLGISASEVCSTIISFYKTQGYNTEQKAG